MRSGEFASAVFWASLKYSKGETVLNQSLPIAPGRDLAHRFVEHVQLAENRLSDRTRMGKRFGALAQGKAEPFGRAVIFENDWSPPIDHRLFDRRGTRRGGVESDLE